MPGKTRRSVGGTTRRQFLTGAAVVAGWAAVSAAPGLLGIPSAAAAHEPEGMPRTDDPLRGGELTPRRGKELAPRPRVVHVHNSDATSWDYATGWYGDFASQEVVSEMVTEGVKALTGASNRAAAWRALIPGYVPGQRVAIKVNLVNAGSVQDGDNVIDALVEPVNAVIQGLKRIGVAESDIWVYDASRTIPDRFRSGCDFAGVQFSGGDVNDQGFSASEMVAFKPLPDGPSLPDQRISQVLVNADYLINMPIMKKHSHAYVTLSFKNHFGSIEKCWEVHEPTFPDAGSYSRYYNPLVDLYRNPHIVGKTVLTIGDGLYGSRGHQSSRPSPWVTFGNRAPNSLFFSRDPVAIDCVMYDFLQAEAGVPSEADDYLLLASGVGLGVFEHRAPGASGHEDWYSLIDYTYLDRDPEAAHQVYVPLAQK